MNLSLKQRLLLLMLGAMTVVWLTAALLTWRDARHELSEILDAHLAQASVLLVLQFSHELDDLDEDDFDPETLEGNHPYAKQIAFQVWEDGDELVLRSRNAPQTALAGSRAGFSDASIDNEQWRVYSAWDRKSELLIHVAERQALREELAGRVIRNLLMPLWLTLPVLAVLLWLAVSAGLRPLERLTRAVAVRSPHNLTPLNLTAPRELTPLLQRLNHLFLRIERLLDNERRFTADAAHELRTPLASIKAQVQVAQASRDNAEREQALEKAVLGCNRTTHLITQLLTLARLESTVGNTAQDCSLQVLATEVIAELAPSALREDKHLALQGEAPPLPGQPLLLQVLLNNLLDNAIRHTPAGTEVVVTVERLAEATLLSVCDDGPGLALAEREQITRRFYRGQQAGSGGSGLGLSIVQRIAGIHGAVLNIGAGSGGSGLCVSVRFPDQRPSQAGTAEL